MSCAGEALDQKTRCLRSMQAVIKKAATHLRPFGSKATRVKPRGPEKKLPRRQQAIDPADLIHAGAPFQRKAAKGRKWKSTLRARSTSASRLMHTSTRRRSNASGVPSSAP